MASGNDADQDLAHNLILANDDFGNFAQDGLGRLVEIVYADRVRGDGFIHQIILNAH